MSEKVKEVVTKTKIGWKNWVLIWVLGLAGQLCWNIENQWFNTFVYAKVGPYSYIISWMTAVSAIATTFSTFFCGTLSDRKGKRRPFIFFGYLFWGIFTMAFGALEFLPKNNIVAAGIMVVLVDALMSFFGSMGNDSAFSSWTTDITDETNRGQLGAAIAVLPVAATIVGTVVSGILIEAIDYFAYFMIVGALIAVIGVVGALVMKEGKSLKPNVDEKGFWHQFGSVFNFRTVKQNKELFWVLLIIAVYFICFNFYFIHIGNYFIYGLGFAESETGIIQGIGLGIAVFATIPAIRFINKGRHGATIVVSTILSIIGLIILSFAGHNIVITEIGIVLAGIGYVLVLQTTTAWIKNLYPENQRGQFEGVRLVFFVLLPMIFGPSAASVIIENWGIPVVIDGKEGMAPSSALFLGAAILSALVLVPTYFAIREKKKKELSES